MGNVAGSGGYFIAMPADKILASPLTLTGSIGVIAGKFVTRELLEKNAKVTFDSYQTHPGDNSSLFSSLNTMTKEQKQRALFILTDMYEMFKGKVANWRKLDANRSEELAQGKVYFGSAAKELGLVDQVGGLTQALEVAKQECSLSKKDRVQIEVFPRKTSLLRSILLPAENSEDPEGNIVGGFVSGMVGTLISPVVRVLSFVFEPLKTVLNFVNLSQKDNIMMYTDQTQAIDDVLLL